MSVAVLLASAAAVQGQSALDGFDPNANGAVLVVVVQADGKILLGGEFTALRPNGAFVARNYIARLNPDGTIDTAFNPNAGFHVYSIAVQTDGKILVGGQFASVGGQTRNGIARLDAATGSADSFNPNANGFVQSIGVQANGKILAGGGFGSIGGQTRNCIARLDAATGLADSFNPNANNAVGTIVVQADGKILVGGSFTSVGGQTRNRIARLDAATGLADSFNPNANNNVRSIAVQVDGTMLVGGIFTSIGGQMRNCITRLDATTGLADSFNPNANAFVRSIVVQSDGKILVAGHFSGLNSMGGQTRNRIARLDTNGKVDKTLNLGTTGTQVLATAIQLDGKILIGGSFTAVLGEQRGRIARLNTDGTLDMAFSPTANDAVYSIAVQANGKILAGGLFTGIGGFLRNRIARLDPVTGLADSFNPNANGHVLSIDVQADGKILAAGLFTSIGGQTRSRIARLDPTTGLADPFNPNANGDVFTIAVQSNGKILAGGAFASIGGQTRNRIARLDAATGLADSFNPNANDSVQSIAVQADGKILVGGYFNGVNSIGGQARNRIARLDATTGLADSFNPNANDFVQSIAVQADGKVLAGGGFGSIGGQTRTYIARLNGANGLADSFNPNANNFVFSIAVQPDGKVLAGGFFTIIGGQTRKLFARLSNDTAALQDLAVTQTTVVWTRGGSSPHFKRVTFEHSTDNANYTPMGNGTPAGSNWTLTGLNLSTGQSCFIRARGYYCGGYFNGSESITESVRKAFIPVPATGVFALNPDNARVRVGETVNYEVVWTVPDGEVWRDLNTIDLRVRGCDKTPLWVRWDESSNTFSLCDNAGNPGPGGLPGSNVVLQTEGAVLYLSGSSVVGSGPTGTSVTLNLAMSFKDACGSCTVELAATDDLGHQDDLVVGGVLRILR